jgi:hypothetical protein
MLKINKYKTNTNYTFMKLKKVEGLPFKVVQKSLLFFLIKLKTFWIIHIRQKIDFFYENSKQDLLNGERITNWKNKVFF